MQRFVDEHGLDGFVHIDDYDEAVASSLLIQWKPTFVYLDGNGSASQSIGLWNHAELTTELRRLSTSPSR